MKTVWIYFNTLHKVGHPDHVRVFATRETAGKWLADIDPLGTVFEYDVLGQTAPRPEPLSKRKLKRDE
jgi:hypothetical protein